MNKLYYTTFGFLFSKQLRSIFALGFILILLLPVGLYAQPGKSLRFSGTQYITVPAKNTITANNFTVMAWVMPASISGAMHIFSTRESGEFSFDMQIVNGNKIHADIGNGSSFLTTAADVDFNYVVNQWLHIAYTVSPTGYKIYVNGNEVGGGVLSGSTLLLDATHQIIIGKNANENTYFKGNIDEVKVYNSTLTAADVKADMLSTTSSLPAQLLAYYNFEQSGNVLNDRSGNGYDGTVTGAGTSWVESYAMVMASGLTTTGVSANEFTANWTAPINGTLDDYLLEVSTKPDFTVPVIGSPFTVTSTSKTIPALSGNTYYYRVKADKASVSGQGAWSETATVTTIAAYDKLSALTLSEGTLSQPFSTDQLSYAAIIAASSVKLVATQNSPTAVIEMQVNSGPFLALTSGSQNLISLNLGMNTIKVKVSDGLASRIYTLTINRIIPVKRYVKPVATGSKDGLTWQNASDDLQLMMNNSVAFDSVFVAAGTYRPIRNPENVNVITINDQMNSFLLKANVMVYGGFAGTETRLAERDLTQTGNKSILSGDFNNDDVRTGSKSSFDILNRGENAFHVVLSMGEVGGALLDGFTITGGNGNYGISRNVNGTNFLSYDAGGIVVNSSSPRLRNLNITGNYGESGGGMKLENAQPIMDNLLISWNKTRTFGAGIEDLNSSFILTNSTISDNVAFYGSGGGSGGAISIRGGTPVLKNILLTRNFSTQYGGGIYTESASPIIINCIISENESLRFGGGISCRAASSPQLTNVLIANNKSDRGGGLFLAELSPVLTNVTISGNSASLRGGAMENFFVTNLMIRNSVIWGNGGPSAKMYNQTSSPTISYSLLEEAAAGTGNISVDPLLKGDYSLQEGSPAINAGSNIFFDSGQSPDLSAVVTDLKGNARKANGTVDMGAYETSTLSANLVLSNLSQTYDGTAKSAIVTTSPIGLTGVSITYDGSSTAPTAAGTYAVVASLTNSNYTAQDATGSLVIGKATASIVLSGLTATYDGTSKSVTATTNPAGLNGVTLTYDGLATAPTAAGAYAVVASLNNPNYTSPDATGNLVISKATASIVLSSLTATYDGTAKSAAATTNPAGLSGITITYDGSSTAPTAAGTYAVVASLSNPNYTAPDATGNLVIGKATASITLISLSATYDGTSKSATATTNPAGLNGVTLTYDGLATAPTAAGTYAVVGSLNNPNYTAPDATGSLVIGKATASIALSGLSATYDGSAKSVTATTNPVGLSGVSITYEGSSTAPTAAGTYAVVASLNNPNYTSPDATGNLVIGKATASIALSGLTATYDGISKPVIATTNPAGLSGVSITYDGSSTAPTAAGTYTVTASLTNANYTAPDATGSLVIDKATASIVLSNLTATYDGIAKPAIATTNPVGLSGISITYDGLATAPTAVGTYAVVASLNNPNYTAPDATGNLVIGKATASIALSGLTATYDGTSKSIIATTDPAGLSGVSITYDGSSTAPTAAGTYTVTASLINANYTAPDATGSLVIGKAAASIALSSLSATYDGTSKSVTATTNPVGLSGVSITYDGSSTAPTAAGTYSVVASLTNSNYTAPDATGSFVIGKAAASIALSSLSATYDGTSKSATATTNPAGLNGITITYDGSSTVPTAAGTYAVVASLSNPNYTAPDATGSFVISKATASITLNSLSATYDGTSKSVTATTNPVGLNGITITYDESSTAPTAAGTYTVTASLTNANYTAPDATGSLVIDKATASIVLSNLTATYDGIAKPAIATTNPVGLSGISITYDGLATAPTAVGTYAVVASLNNPNYTAPDATGNLVIGKATASIALNGLTATYDGTAKSVTATTNPVGLSGVSITYDGSSTAPTAAGTYAVVASLNNPNYTSPDATGNLVIGKATASVALSGLTVIYDGISKPVIATTNPAGLNGITITYDGSSTVPTAAGTYAVVASLNNPNYTSPDATGNLVIGKATASITLSGLTATYDGTSKPVTATTNPVGLSGISITYDGLATAPTAAGTYAVVASLNNPNYTSLDATGNLMIGKATASIALSGLTATYDGTAKSVTVTTNPVGLTGVTITYDGLATAPIAAGTYVVVASLNNPNYTAPDATGNLVIGKAIASIALSGLTATYDGTAKSVTATTSPVGLSGVSITYDGLATAPIAAGTYAVVASLNNPNYTSPDATGNLVIGKATASVALSGLTVIYDGIAKSATATTNPVGLSGISITYDGLATAPTAVGTYAVVASLTNPNYTAPDATGNLVIGKATASIALSGLSATYDGTSKSATATTNPAGLNGISITYDGSATAPTAAGTYAVVASLNNSNYTAPDATGNLVIGKATASIALSGLTATYDGTAKSATATTNPVGLSGVSITYDGSSTAPTAAGTYAVVASLNNPNYTSPDVTGSLVIGKATASIALSGLSATYDGTSKSATATTNPAGLNGISITYDGSATAPTAAGTYAVVASLNNSNYTAPDATGNLVIGKATASIALSGLTATYDGTAKLVTATTNPVGLSGVSITYDGSSTAPTAAGTYAVVASLNNPNYTSPDVTGSLVIGKATASIALSSLSATYDGTAKSVTATTNPVGLSGISIIYDGLATAPIAAGTYAVVASLNNPNYTSPDATGNLVIGKATASIALSALSATYDGTAKSITVTTNPVGLSGISITYDGSATAPTAAGTYAVVASLNNPNYTSPDATGNLVIGKATASIALSGLSATYDGTAKSVIATTNPVGLSGISITYDVLATAPIAAGTYAVVASLNNPNYTSPDATGNLVIGKATASITLSGLSATYDGTAKSVTATTNPVGLSGISIIYDGLATAPIAAGTYAVVASLNNPNYTSPDATGNLVIGKATASIALSALSATYDGSAKSVTATTNPVGLSGISITYDGSATAPTAAGTYAVVASLNNPNYTSLDASGNLVIGKATASIALSGLTATYDGTSKSVTATTNPVGLSGISITYDGLATAPTAAGTYAVVASLTNPNYTALDATGSLVIGKAAASIALSSLSATYDGTAKLVIATTNPVGLLGIDITYDGSATAPTTAGTYAVVASLSNPNYTAPDATGNLVIGKATASITLSSLSVTYDGTSKSATATTNPVGLSGISITYDGLATAPIAAGTYVVVVSLNNPNYTSPDATGNLVIGKGTASIALSGLSATYDGTSKLVIATTNPVGLSGIAITYDGSATAPIAAGTYAVVASLNNSNYAAPDATGSLVIGKAAASIALSGLSATYDGSAKSVTATTNPVGLNGITITYDGLATEPTATGTYAVVASLNNSNYTAPDATGSLVIGKAAASITLSGLTATYDGTAKSVIATTNPIGLSGISITYDGSSTAPTAAGTYAVVASLNNPNYTASDATGNLVIGKATASIALSGLTATYDGSAKSAIATTNPVGLSGISITYDGSATAPTAAGTYAVVASLNNSNYAAPDATGSLVIGKATASIALSGLSATYDGSAKSVIATTNPVGLSRISITYDGLATAPTAAGTYAVVASLNNPNYSVLDATGSLVIGKATASIALSGLSATYDGSAKSVTATTNPVGLNGVTITYDGLATAPTAAGTYAVVASLNNPNYTAPDATGNLVIGKATASIALSSLSATYDGTSKSVTATTNPVGLTGISITYDGYATAPTAAGTYAVVASLNNSNYTATDATGNLVIGKAAASITLSGLTATYDGTAKSVIATTNPIGLSGISITYDGSSTAPTAAGTYAVVASLNNPNYTAPDATGNLVIGKATASIALSGLTATYDGTAKSVIATTNPIGLSGISITYDGSSTVPTAAGTYAVVASLNSPNYTAPDATSNLVISKAAASIALSGLSATYDGTAKSATATTNPAGLSGVSITYDGLVTAPTAAGTYVVVASLNNPNYTSPDATGNLVIGKATASIALSGLTATYDGSAKSVTATTNPIGLSGISITYDGLATAPTAVGTYAVVASLNNPNYTAPDATGSLVIGKATASIALSGLSATYDGTAKSVTATTNPVGLSGVSITYDGSSTAPTAAGTYAVVASLNNPNYTSPDATGNLVIGKATASIALSNLTATYDGIAKSATATTNPAGLNGISITYDGSATAPTAAGTYAVVASLSNPNYTSPDATGNLVIGKATASIALDGLSATYDGSAKSVTATTNPAGLPGISITYDGLATAPTTAGTYAVVASLSNPNYTATDATGNLVISRGTASIALSGLTATYDGTSKSVIVTTNPVGLSGISITYDGLVTAPTAAGTYAVVASLNNPNYTAPDATGNLVIGKAIASIALNGLSATYDGTSKPVTATTNPVGLTGISITYDGSATAPTAAGTYAVVVSLNNPNYTAPDATGNLVIGKATASIALSGLSATYDGTSKSVTATTNPVGLNGVAITYDGLATAPTAAGTYAVVASLTNPNYTSPDATGNLVIGKATASITLSGLSATYDGTAKSVTATTNPAGLSGVSITYDGSANAPTAAGTYAVVASLINPSYTVPDATGNLVISRKSITITADAKTKTFGDADPALTYQITGTLISPDMIIGSLIRNPGESPGAYAITQGSLALNNNYNLIYVGANLTIENSKINFPNLPLKTYGDADFDPGASSVNTTKAINYSSDNSMVAVIANGKIHILSAGTANITASQEGAASVTRTLTVSKASLKVTANHQSRIYGTANPELTVVYIGFVNGDDVTKLTIAATASTVATTASVPDNYPIKVSGAESGNYDFIYVNGVLTVTPFSNADLINLTISSGTLSPLFAKETRSYTASVAYDIDYLVLTLTLSDANATVRINGSTSRDVSLNPGNNTISVEITAQDKITKNTYVLNVYRGMPVQSITATNILTPNNDGKNDTWVIQDIELYPNNKVTVYDRAGRVVYTKHGYTNDWGGTLNGTGSTLVEDTYYYIVDLGIGKSPFKGFITIIGNR